LRPLLSGHVDQLMCGAALGGIRAGVIGTASLLNQHLAGMAVAALR